MAKNKRIWGAAGGAVGVGGVAAALGTCCVAPWAVTLLGVSGAVTLARLAAYQPYVLAAGGVLLALAFYWVYRPEPVCDDGSCEPANRRRQRVIVWAAAAVFAVVGAISILQTI